MNLLPGDGNPEDASSSLVASSSYLDMLTDKRRNRAFNTAIRDAVEPGTTDGTKPQILIF